VKELGEFWKSSFPSWTIRHENDIAKPSTRDRHWIPRLNTIKKDGDWLIITSDRGANDRRRGEKLPVVCRKHGHAYLILSQTVSKYDAFKAAFSAVWPSLPLVVKACKKLKHANSHVILSQVSIKANQIGYRIQVRGVPIEDWMEPDSN
jgi:hypothetical protein